MINGFNFFQESIQKYKLNMVRKPIETLQLNLGKLCNQACLHCHVDAGPKRTEIMDLETVHQILKLLKRTESIKTVDLTGGAPEMNPHFKFLVKEISALGKTIIDRCNLTVLLEKDQKHTAEFLKEYKVQIVSSLPCYLEENVDKQRGRGVFSQSITALKMLNNLGYGIPGSELELNLVFNPQGPLLPPDQIQLEKDYKVKLQEEYGIKFNRLFTITNMPINRFRQSLKRNGDLKMYMQLLIDNFNPHSAIDVMCKNLISVSWDGLIYDCDFNQMLNIHVGNKKTSIWDLNTFNKFDSCEIATEDHCFGCTAGAGSSCTGALT